MVLERQARPRAGLQRERQFRAAVQAGYLHYMVATLVRVYLMRSKVFTITLTLACTGCASVRTELVTPCASKSNLDVIKSLTSIVVTEGMRVSVVDADVGLLEAVTSESIDWAGAVNQGRWTFTIRNDTVRAFATASTIVRNPAGA